MYGQLMLRNYKKRREKITFEALMQILSTAFTQILDHRRANSSYKLADLLRSAFAMFSLKSPSLLCFREQTKVERENLQAIYLETFPAIRRCEPGLIRLIPSRSHMS